MDIICKHCQSKFKIANDKIPQGKKSSFPCPKCKSKILINQKTNTNIEVDNDFLSDYSEKFDEDFDFDVEEGKSCLLCELETAVNNKIKKELKNLNYNITEAINSRDALRKIKHKTFNFIIVNELFDTNDNNSNGVLLFLERMDMSIRRNITVVLISRNLLTMDKMIAFNKSVNVVINVNNASDAGKIIGRTISENDFFYSLFKKSLQKADRTT